MRPLTHRELRARTAKARIFATLWAAASIGAIAAGRMMDVGAFDLAGTLLLVSLIACYFQGGITFVEAAQLDGEGCMRVRELAVLHPEVRDFLQEVNRLDRPVVWADLWTINTWLRQRRACDERAACRAINGIENA